jgi:hypothetical protein
VISVPADSPFQHIRYPQGFGYLVQVAFVISPILHDRATTDDFELCYLGQIIQDLVLDAVREVGIIFVWTDVIEGKHCDAFLGCCRFRWSLVK